VRKLILLTVAVWAVALVACGCQARPVAPPDPQPPETTAAAPVDDPLAAKLRDAYAADSATPSKLVRVRQLAACYRFAAVALAQNPDTVTEGQLHDQLVTATTLALPTGALKGVRRAIADELAAKLGTDASKRLDAQADRDAASVQLARIALILEGVK
jgi:hypothetical protein